MTNEPGPEPRKPGGLGAWTLGAWVGTLVVLLVVFAWLMGKDEGKRQAKSTTPAQQVAEKQPPATTKTTATAPAAAAGPGKELFAATCSGCHTLAAADAHGTVGPNLDDLKPDAALVETAIHDGGTGSGAMPKDLLQGEQATQVAEFVAKATGSG
jgi:mono/diheme cytochrome c family protein